MLRHMEFIIDSNIELLQKEGYLKEQAKRKMGKVFSDKRELIPFEKDVKKYLEAI